MNKILLNNEIKENILIQDKYNFIEDGTFSLIIENLEQEIFVTISPNTKIKLNVLGKNTNLKLNINIGENANLILNHLVLEGSININTILKEFNANFELNYSVASSNNSKNIINIKHKAPKTKSLLKNHGFSTKKATLILDVSSYIDKDASNCISKQDNQIIENENSLSVINPNLYIDNYDVEATHSAYVGEFKENELFYLMSRGITEEDSKFLLLKSFLIGSFDLEEKIKERYYHEVIKYFNKEV